MPGVTSNVDVLGPPFQAYVDAPETVRVAVSPIQMMEGVDMINKGGPLEMEIVLLVVALQPLLLIPRTL